MKNDPRHEQVIQWLREQGHTDMEIEMIVTKLADYDARTMHESIFDSIDAGSIDLASIVKEALAEQEESGG